MNRRGDSGGQSFARAFGHTKHLALLGVLEFLLERDDIGGFKFLHVDSSFQLYSSCTASVHNY